MDVHDETTDDLIGEGTIIIDGRNERVSYWLTVSPEGDPVLAEGSISGSERLIRSLINARNVKLAVGATGRLSPSNAKAAQAKSSGSRL